MRIKKKHIKENLDLKINNRVNKVKSAIDQTAGDFEQMGIGDSKSLAADVVSSALSSDGEMNEDSISDSQRKFFNAVHKCKVDGDCPSSEIKKAAEGMSLSDIEDFAFTKGELPDSVDEVGGDHFGDDEKLDIEVGADDYEEYQELLKNIGNHGKPIDLDSVEDGLPFESVRPKMTKNELVESVKNIGKNNKTPRKVVKTFKVKNLKNGKKY